jgi:hypothetical protein
VPPIAMQAPLFQPCRLRIPNRTEMRCQARNRRFLASAELTRQWKSPQLYPNQSALD